MTGQPPCRFCERPLRHVFADLGETPLANSYLEPAQLNQIEPRFPLLAHVCEGCYLVQLQQFEAPGDIFGDYAYFSSFSESWLAHARSYCQEMLRRLSLKAPARIIEIASNDGYLLKNFLGRGFDILGIEPAVNVAIAARQAGVTTMTRFFDLKLAREMASQNKQADLLIANNVIAHVPDLNDFIRGINILLKPGGVCTLEFPHLLNLMQENQFDTIYHEHFSYFSFSTLFKIFTHHGLTLFDVETLPTHGGSLRVYARHTNVAQPAITHRVTQMRQKEAKFGLNRIGTYANFGKNIEKVRADLLVFLAQAKQQGKTVVGYGAPAKGNTLLNYCRISSDLISYTVDRSPHKQGRFLPGTRIPVLNPKKIQQTRPDYLLILPWNLKGEIMQQMKSIRSWGGKFVTPIPKLQIY
ncbi:MAG: class I SAM-dependent methyltransferase [Magnetococcales bacterium]|nr:class I SAM-dependent methyltransferase [Magnetococcales bacterium]